MSNKLGEYRPVPYSFPDSLNLFTGSQELVNTSKDYVNHPTAPVVKAGPKDLISFSTDKIESGSTLKEAYRPYSGRNYVPTAAARVPTADGQKSMVKTTKAIHIPARPRTQLGMSREKFENMTSYSYQFSGQNSEKSEPYRPKSEMEGPSGEQSFVSTNGDYTKHSYGRPYLNYIHDNVLFDKSSLGEGSTNKQHFAAPNPTKGPNLRPKTSVILGKDNFVPKSSYKKQFDGVKDVFAIST